jgi:dinuclear metal center YbgI/SA1388 family protein
MKLASLVEYLDGYLRITGHPDYPTALNGLQVEGRSEVERVCGAVDASEAAIDAARAAGADLLIVHHGLFWDGLRPVTGRRRRKLAKLLQAELSVMSVHLPLDAHVEIGNCILLARALGIEPTGRFGAYQGADIGWWGGLELSRGELARRAETVLGGPVRVLEGGSARVQRVGVLTGSGAFVEDAARLGVDTVITGEGPHHVAIDAAELGINVLYGGHYATETFGLRALGAHLGERFGLTHQFLDLPTGT